MAAVLVTVAGLLAGCGSPSAEPSAQLVRLTSWNGYAGPDTLALESTVGEFNAARPGVRVEMGFMPWDVFFRSLFQAYSTGGGPDLAAFDSTRVAQYAKKGVPALVDDWFAADPASNVLVTAATEAVA